MSHIRNSNFVLFCSQMIPWSWTASYLETCCNTNQKGVKFELILISNNWICVAINLISNWYKKLDQNRIKLFDPVLISFRYLFDIKMDSTMDQNFCSCFDCKYNAILISKWEQISSSIDTKLLMRKTFLNRNKFMSRIKIGS